MKWTKEADEAISKVPFFVRKRVRKRVEEEAVRRGAGEVCLDHVRTCQKRFLERMEDEVKGYQVETCFGATGCTNRAVIADGLVEKIEYLLADKKIKEFLKERVKGPLKMHHEFRISVSDCPNACSRPQIVDVGLIGASKPRVSDTSSCIQCQACVQVCREEAITLNGDSPHIDDQRCLSCGKCILECPTGTLEEENSGYRILLGGKLGRHPRFGQELPGIYSAEQALRAIEKCLDHYQSNCQRGERFGEILEKTELWQKNHKKFEIIDLDQG